MRQQGISKKMDPKIQILALSGNSSLIGHARL
jgi:hypothetical protein